MQVFINTYGTYLHVKQEMFEIRVKPAPKEKVKINHIAAHKIKSFVVSKGAAISTDAIALALKHNIDIVVVENDGHPMGRFWHSKLGSTTKIRKKQLEASTNEIGLNTIKEWLSQKIENQAGYVEDLRKHRPKIKMGLTKKIDRLYEQREKIASIEAETVPEVAETIRGIEGTAGRIYFDAISNCITQEFQFKGRSFRPAADPFNAMLNYCYGILYSRIERALMLAGLDPYIGFLHRDDYNMKSLVFDFIEPYRIYAERCVFTLFSTKKVNQSFFEEISGGISLNQEGKPVVVEAFSNYLDQHTIKYLGKNQTRYNAIQTEAHRFANQLISPS
jgi:CRISPR-associated protein Cas1